MICCTSRPYTSAVICRVQVALLANLARLACLPLCEVKVLLVSHLPLCMARLNRGAYALHVIMAGAIAGTRWCLPQHDEFCNAADVGRGALRLCVSGLGRLYNMPMQQNSVTVWTALVADAADKAS
jgi:hypothetical protein